MAKRKLVKYFRIKLMKSYFLIACYLLMISCNASVDADKEKKANWSAALEFKDVTYFSCDELIKNHFIDSTFETDQITVKYNKYIHSSDTSVYDVDTILLNEEYNVKFLIEKKTIPMGMNIFLCWVRSS